MKLGITPEIETVVLFYQMCSFSMQKWEENRKVIALFKGLGCYYVVFGKVDVTATRLLLSPLKLLTTKLSPKSLKTNFQYNNATRATTSLVARVVQ